MTRAASNGSGAVGTVALDTPSRPKGSGAWTTKRAKVAYYDGETAADAEAFAAAIAASADAMRARELARRALAVEPLARCKHEGPANIYGAGDQTGPHSGDCKYLAPRAIVSRLRDDRGLAELVAAFHAEPRAERAARAARLAERVRAERAAEADRVAVASVARALASSGPSRAGPEHPGYAAGYCAECYADAHGGTFEPAHEWPSAAERRRVSNAIGRAAGFEPEPAQDDPSGPDAPVVASEPIEAPIVAPEPAAEPTHYVISAAELIAAAAPVLAIVAPRTRPTCERCGQTFRISGNGAEWHRINRPDCASVARPALAIVR